MSAAAPNPLKAEMPQSPYLDGSRLQFAWDSVSLGNILACPRRYQLEQLEGWRPKAPSSAIALDFGILFHKGLEIYYVERFNGKSKEEAQVLMLSALLRHHRMEAIPVEDDIEEAEALFQSDDSDIPDDGIDLRNSKIRTRYHLFRALIWYTEHYEDDAFETLVVFERPAVEVSFRVEVPVTVDSNPVILCGHIDRGVKFNGLNYVTDYKTTKGLSRQFFSSFELSHQFTGYTYAGQIVFDQPVRGAFIDGIALQVGGVKFGRSPTNRTDSQFQEYFRTFQMATDLAAECAETGFYPMNTQSCYFCKMKEVCSQPPEFQRAHLKEHFYQAPSWNPLENR